MNVLKNENIKKTPSQQLSLWKG